MGGVASEHSKCTGVSTGCPKSLLNNKAASRCTRVSKGCPKSHSSRAPNDAKSTPKAPKRPPYAAARIEYTKVGSADWHDVVNSAVPTLQRMVPWGHSKSSWAYLASSRTELEPFWGRLGSHLEKCVGLLRRSAVRLLTNAHFGNAQFGSQDASSGSDSLRMTFHRLWAKRVWWVMRVCMPLFAFFRCPYLELHAQAECELKKPGL